MSAFIHSIQNNWELSSLDPLPSYQPTSRPIAEPPIFDYDRFMRLNRNQIPSDIRLKRLFANDIGMGYRWRDEMTEDRLLKQYIDWTDNMQTSERSRMKSVIVGSGKLNDPRLFYEELYKELCEDAADTRGANRILEEAMDRGVISAVQLWEYKYLDEDGGTANVRRQLQDGENVFSIHASLKLYRWDPDNQALQNYEFLIPPDYFERLYWAQAWATYIIDGKIFDAMLERYRDVKWLHERLTKWRQNVIPIHPSSRSLGPVQRLVSIPFMVDGVDEIPSSAPPSALDPPSLEQELAMARNENEVLRKRVAELEDSNLSTKKAKFQKSRKG